VEVEAEERPLEMDCRIARVVTRKLLLDKEAFHFLHSARIVDVHFCKSKAAAAKETLTAALGETNHHSN